MVSNLFIDEYMKSANDAQIKIYLYLLRVMSAHRPTSVSDLADQFNHTEKDVIRSLRYWEQKGLLNLTFRENGSASAGDLVSVCLRRPEETGGQVRRDRHVLSFSSPARDCAGDAGGNVVMKEALPLVSGGPILAGGPAGAVPAGQTAPPAAGHTGPVALSSTGSPSGAAGPAGSSSRPAAGPIGGGSGVPASAAGSAVPASAAGSASAAPAERSDLEALETFRTDAGRAQLLFVIEQYIGKPLSMNEIRIIYNISESLHFSDDLIDYLIQYCVDRGKKDFRYIRAVADNWAAEGIMTPSQAEALQVNPDSGKKKRKGAAAGGSRPDTCAADTGSPAGAGTVAGPAVRRRSRNSFNQFEQNSYDFDALEEELLHTSV